MNLNYVISRFFFFFLGLYQIPENLKRANIIEEVTNLSTVPHPEGMGLSENSATVRDLRDSKRLLHGILLTQPGVAELVYTDLGTPIGTFIVHMLSLKNSQFLLNDYKTRSKLSTQNCGFSNKSMCTMKVSIGVPRSVFSSNIVLKSMPALRNY